LLLLRTSTTKSTSTTDRLLTVLVMAVPVPITMPDLLALQLVEVGGVVPSALGPQRGSTRVFAHGVAPAVPGRAAGFVRELGFHAMLVNVPGFGMFMFVAVGAGGGAVTVDVIVTRVGVFV